MHKGMHFTGEILDVVGPCGGYNLHFAFASGAIAGQSASKTES
jgi:predicted flavoprotein YhiN